MSIYRKNENGEIIKTSGSIVQRWNDRIFLTEHTVVQGKDYYEIEADASKYILSIKDYTEYQLYIAETNETNSIYITFKGQSLELKRASLVEIIPGNLLGKLNCYTLDISIGNIWIDNYAELQQIAEDIADKLTKIGGNTIEGTQTLNNGIYTCQVNSDGYEFYDAGVLIAKINTNGFYKKSTVAGTGDYLLSATEAAALVTAHNDSESNHTDIRNLILALQGAYIYRGSIASTTTQIVADQTLLDARILVLMTRIAITGDVLVDSNENEWYYNGSIWNNYGQGLVGLASAVSDGFITKEDFTKLYDLYTKAQLDATFAKLTDLDNAKSIYGWTKTNIGTFADTGTAVLAIASLVDYDFIYFQYFNDDAVDIHATQQYRRDLLTNGLISYFEGNGTVFASINVDATNINFNDLIGTNYCFVTGIKMLPFNSSVVEISSPSTESISGSSTTQQEINVEVKTAIETTNVKLYDTFGRLITLEETVRKAEESTEVSTVVGSDIISLGKDVAPAPLKLQIDGMLLKAENELSNPYFDTNINDWSLGFTVLTWYESGIAFNIATGADSYGYIGQNVLTSGDKYYVKTQGYVTNIDCIYLGIGGNVDISLGADNPVKDTMYQINGFFTATGTLFALIHSYADAITANGKIMLNYSTYLYNISTLIARKQYSTLYSTTFDLMSDAQIKAQMDLWILNGTLPDTDLMSAGFNKRARSIGKNLFDRMNIYIPNKYFDLSGILRTEASYDSYIVKVNPSIVYKKTFIGGYTSYFDINMNFISSVNDSANLTTPANCYYVGLGVTKTNQPLAMLEYGSTATTYEPYAHSDMFIKGNANGYILPNLTKDTIEFRDGKAYYIKRLTVVAVTGVVAVNTTNYPTALTGGQFINYLTAGGSETGVIGTNSTSGDGTLVYAIATPITTEIEARGILYGYPNGTVLIDDIMEDIALYSTSAVIENSSYPITALESIVKFDVNGVETVLAVSGATIAGDGLSFTHAGLTAGDYVYFTYYYGDNVRGLVTVTYYDSKVVVTDSVTATVYKITPAIASGVLTWTLTAI